MWTNFMWKKYCKRHCPQVVEWRGGSQLWKHMLLARDDIDQQIWWEPRCGNSNIWFDNWTQLGALYYYLPVNYSINIYEEDVSQLMLPGRWNEDLVQQLFPDEVCNHIIRKIGVVEDSEEWDRSRWMLQSSGKFSMNSA